MKNFKIVEAVRLDDRNWNVTLEGGETWNFKRREFLDVLGDPVYEVYPPYGHELKLCLNIGLRNNRKHYYVATGFGEIENIGQSLVPIEKNTDVDYILSQYYNN